MKPSAPASSTENPPPAPSGNTILTLKLSRLEQILRSMETVAVAFSGGIDSALLLRVALDTLTSERVVAYTAQSEITPEHEIEDASRLTSKWGVEHHVLEASDLNDPEFVRNAENRCYVCKKRRFSLIQDHARQRGIQWLVDGENVDDAADFRPGSAAAQELGARSPLREAGLTKSDIRSLAQALGIDIWNKPASACLASRIPYGTPITAEKLVQIDRAESRVRRLGIAQQVRVRHHGLFASLELDPEGMARLADPHVRQAVLESLKRLGFSRVLLDLEGYRSGSLNPAITPTPRNHS